MQLAGSQKLTEVLRHKYLKTGTRTDRSAKKKGTEVGTFYLRY